MNKADEIYLGKVFVDYSDAINETGINMGETTDIMKAIMDGLGISDGRPDELSMYQFQLKQLVMYAESKGVSLGALFKLGEDYKKVSFNDFMTMKSQLTIKEEIDALLN